MRAYAEYENLDEYETDGEDLEEDEAGEEEYEEEEAHQPTQEEVEYLGLRQRLKEAIRKKMKKDSGSANSSSLGKKTLSAKDNFGCFFGPSQPVIAARVIEESKSLLENPDIAMRAFKSSNTKTKSSASTPVGSKPRANSSAPKVINVLKKKVERLKDTRDYSFLLSDDTESPAPAKDRRPQNVSVPNSDVRSAKMQHRIREPLSNSGRKVPDGREERKFKPSGSQAQGTNGTQKVATVSKPRQTSGDPKKQLPSNKGVRPARPSMEKAVPSKIPVGTLQKKVCAPGARSAMPQHKPAPTKLQPSVSRQPLVQKREIQRSCKEKVPQKHTASSSKHQIKQAPPRYSSHMEDERARRKPVRRDGPRRRHEDEDLDPLIEIRKMFSYDPNKYKDDDDVSDMEANFEDIQREEKRSARIAKQEDEIALREIEEEEERERLRKEARKRKLSQR